MVLCHSTVFNIKCNQLKFFKYALPTLALSLSLLDGVDGAALVQATRAPITSSAGMAKMKFICQKEKLRFTQQCLILHSLLFLKTRDSNPIRGIGICRSQQ